MLLQETTGHKCLLENKMTRLIESPKLFDGLGDFCTINKTNFHTGCERLSHFGFL